MDRPNVLYLHSHDTGRYIAPYGYPVDTPKLQAFAQRALLFRHALTVNPTCSPSRSALLTGQWPTRNGMLGLAHRGSRLNDPSRHLSRLLKAQGYESFLVGIQHEAAFEEEAVLGYTRLKGPPGPMAHEQRDRVHADLAARFLRERGRGEKPFFLSCGFFTTHRYGVDAIPRGPDGLKPDPHNTSTTLLGDSRYVRPPPCLPDTPMVRADFADFCVAVRRLDGLMGDVLDALDASGLAERTLVVLTTDHGIAFPGMKCNLTDHGTGVLLMLAGPGLEAFAGRVIEPMVTHLDVLPTLLELLGLPDPGQLDGKSMLPLLAGRVDSLHDAVFGMVNFHAAYEPMRSVRTTRYRYIRRWDAGTRRRVLPNCDDSWSKRELMARGWADRPPPSEELFDLFYDPTEACNVADQPAYASVLDDLRTRLTRWMDDIDDPLRAGVLRPPRGLVYNDPDQASPSLPTGPPAA